MTRIPFLLLSALVICLIFVFTPIKTTADPLKTATIVRGQNFPPYHYEDSDGQLKGFVIEIIQETAKIMDLKVSIKQYPWSRCLKMVETGQADAMMNLFKTPAREKFMIFSDNVLATETNCFFTLNTSGITFDGRLSTIRPYRIGTIRNYSYGNAFDTFVFPHKYALETEKKLINSLVHGRGDVIIGNQITVSILLRQVNLNKNVVTLMPAVSEESLYLGFSKKKGHAHLSEQFSRALRKFKQTPDYKQILSRYLPGSN